MHTSPANDNQSTQGMLANEHLSESAYKTLVWYDKLDACDEMRLSIWQGVSGKTVPDWSEVTEHRLLRTAQEIARAAHIREELISIGRV